MDEGGRDESRVLVCSSRPRVIRDLLEELERIRVRDGAGVETAGAAPAVVFLDLGSDEVSVPQARAALGREAAIVVLVDNPSMDRLIDALAAGASDYLFYPFNPRELRLLWRKLREGNIAPRPVLGQFGGGRFRMEFPSEVRHLELAVARVVEACRSAAGMDERAAFRLRVAVSEAVANAILYGNREDPRARVTVEAAVEPEEVSVTVADEGEGFDPAGVPDPTRTENLRRSRGRGLFLLRTLMDRVAYNEVGNRVTLTIRVRDDGSRRGGGVR